MDSKIFIKVNENAEDKDFTFIVPKECTYEHAKKGVISAFEHIVRLEFDAIKAQIAKEEAEKAAAPAPEAITPEVV
jgi:hypothetical protein